MCCHLQGVSAIFSFNSSVNRKSHRVQIRLLNPLSLSLSISYRVPCSPRSSASRLTLTEHFSLTPCISPPLAFCPGLTPHRIGSGSRRQQEITYISAVSVRACFLCKPTLIFCGGHILATPFFPRWPPTDRKWASEKAMQEEMGCWLLLVRSLFVREHGKSPYTL